MNILLFKGTVLFSIFYLSYGQFGGGDDVSSQLDSMGSEPFDISIADLKKESRKVTTIEEQCKTYKQHYEYYCVRSRIALQNEEVRIICERYDAFCRDRQPATLDHIRRQIPMWRQSGLPKGAEDKLVSCYTSCRENDPTCVHACECINLQWIFDYTCKDGSSSLAHFNCQRWYVKCKNTWVPSPDSEPHQMYKEGIAPNPLVRGVFFGYDPIGNSKVYNKPRDHGISFWRGTQSTVVNWPEGKVATGSTFEVPFIGLDGVYNAVDVGFPNAAAAYRNLMGDVQNPGTGRRRLQKRSPTFYYY
uniref:Cpw-wpc domain-containing protein n=1 Tax=Rhabditophanes sp. KR3021 TaxID=114890 RepID=A0AC35TX95_9BILA